MGFIMQDHFGTINRIYGSLFSIWIGIFLSKNFPLESKEGLLFLIFLSLIISILALLLHTAFTRKERRKRIFWFLFVTGLSFYLKSSILFFGNTVYPNGVVISNLQVALLPIVLITWMITAEFSTIIN